MQLDRPQVAAHGLIAVLAAWQAAAVMAVDVEYYDGLDAILIARAILGDSQIATLSRWPVMPLVALPGEALRSVVGLHPLDFRLAHLCSGLVHVASLIAVHRLLIRACGTGWPTSVAFAAAIPTYMYFSQAPFLSNDIAPGALLFAMTLLSHRQIEAPR